VVFALDRSLNVVAGRRIALVTNIPRPYRQPLFVKLHQLLAAHGGELLVLYFSDGRRHARRQGIPLDLGDYPSRSVAGPELRVGTEKILSIPIKLVRVLDQYRPQAVISGSFGPAGFLSWWVARRHRVPFLIWSGAISRQNSLSSWPQRLWEKFLAGRADACLSYGTAARDYLIELGVNPERIVVGVNAVDVDFFTRKLSGVSSEEGQPESVDNPNQIELLFVGNLFPRKGLTQLLQAVQLAAYNGGNLRLKIIGEGPEKEMLEQTAGALGIAAHVHFIGRKTPVELPAYYAGADLFLMPSLDEIWGLVLNEAMASGLPVIASTLAGATRDLVEHGVNGLAVDPRDVPALARAIETLAADPELRLRMGRAAAVTIRAKATIDHSAAAFIRAIELSFGSG